VTGFVPVSTVAESVPLLPPVQLIAVVATEIVKLGELEIIYKKWIKKYVV